MYLYTYLCTSLYKPLQLEIVTCVKFKYETTNDIIAKKVRVRTMDDMQYTSGSWHCVW